MSRPVMSSRGRPVVVPQHAAQPLSTHELPLRGLRLRCRSGRGLARERHVPLPLVRPLGVVVLDVLADQGDTLLSAALFTFTAIRLSEPTVRYEEMSQPKAEYRPCVPRRPLR